MDAKERRAVILRGFSGMNEEHPLWRAVTLLLLAEAGQVQARLLQEGLPSETRHYLSGRLAGLLDLERSFGEALKQGRKEDES